MIGLVSTHVYVIDRTLIDIRTEPIPTDDEFDLVKPAVGKENFENYCLCLLNQ